jgi:hypothetical protein
MSDRNVTLDDAMSAIRGIGMGQMNARELIELRDAHKLKAAEMFASRVIVEAAEMLLTLRVMDRRQSR